MSKNKKDKPGKAKPGKAKRKYEKPTITSDELELFGQGGGGGGGCNGTFNGGRKSDQNPPDSCDPAKLKT